jgi:hypothetical protein
MLVAGPPGPDADGRAGLRLAAAARRGFPGDSAAAADPHLRVYLSDLARPYGTGLREQPFTEAAGQSYGEMAAALLGDLGLAGPDGASRDGGSRDGASRDGGSRDGASRDWASRDGAGLDLIVLAFAVPDVAPGRSTAAYLSGLCPGQPAAFAVCDQGAAAPFTALRLIGAYAGSGGCARALLVVAEQATLHHELPAPAPLPSRSAAVALLLSVAGPAEVSPAAASPAAASPAAASPVVASPVVASTVAAGPAAASPGQARTARVAAVELAAEVAADEAAGRLPGLAGLAGDDVLVTGPGLVAAGLGGLAGRDGLVAAAAGQPVTGTWWELAGGLDGWARAGRRVVLADYDPITSCLCACVLTPSPAGAARPELIRDGLIARQAS